MNSAALKMETVCFSETLMSIYESTRRHDPEKEHRHLHCRENLKSLIATLFFPGNACDVPFVAVVTISPSGCAVCETDDRDSVFNHYNGVA
jgi:hypothetical protein